MKYLLGVLHGKWIVCPSWVHECIEKLRPVSEEAHEVASDTAGKESGPILGRMYAGLKLLQKWEVKKPSDCTRFGRVKAGGCFSGLEA